MLDLFQCVTGIRIRFLSQFSYILPEFLHGDLVLAAESFLRQDNVHRFRHADVSRTGIIDHGHAESENPSLSRSEIIHVDHGLAGLDANRTILQFDLFFHHQAVVIGHKEPGFRDAEVVASLRLHFEGGGFDFKHELVSRLRHCHGRRLVGNGLHAIPGTLSDAPIGRHPEQREGIILTQLYLAGEAVSAGLP